MFRILFDKACASSLGGPGRNFEEHIAGRSTLGTGRIHCQLEMIIKDRPGYPRSRYSALEGLALRLQLGCHIGRSFRLSEPEPSHPQKRLILCHSRGCSAIHA